MKHFVLLSIAALSLSASAAVTPPCTLAINSQETFDNDWKQFDANSDTYLFSYNADEQGAVYSENKSGAANDWLISPAVTLSAGSTYQITYSVQNLTSYSSDKQDFTVYAGLSQDVAGMTDKIFSETGLSKTSWAVDRSGKFTPTADGDYYFGLNLTSKSYSGNFAVFSVKVEEVAVHPGAVTDVKITPAPLGELKATISWTWPVKNDQGGDQVTITGADIYRGTSSYFTANDASKILTVSDNATPGSEYSVEDNTLTEPGVYYYKIIPFNAAGASTISPSSTASPYIGQAKSISGVSNLKATAVADNDKAISLTWDLPTATDGGYFNPADVAYNIKRSKDGATAVDIASEWKGDLPYVDDTLDALGSYTYTIYTVYNGSTSWSGVKSNPVVTGGTMSLPYSNDFNTQSALDLFTIFHGPDAERDWGISSNALDYWGGTTADAWAVLPVFTLEKGKTYKVSFDTRVSNASSPKSLAVAVGNAPTAEALTDVVFSETIESAIATAKTAYVSVPEDGNYYIAFHCFGPSNFNDIYVDNLLVELTVTTPEPVADLMAEAAPNGELKTILTWKNPTLSTAGDALESVDKIEISRGETVVATLTDLTPGSESSYTDAVETPDYYTYTIKAYLGEYASEPVSITSPWIGFDTPKAPESVTATIDGDSRIIDFTPVTEGIHGGYIDTAALTYTVSRNDETIADDVTESPYVDTTADLPLAAYVYSVAAVNGEYTGEATKSAEVIVGDALDLPYTPDYQDASAFLLWTLDGGWKYNASKDALENSSNNSWAFTPPLNMKKGECQVSFKATCYNYRYQEDMSIYLVTSTEAPIAEDAVKIADFHVESAGFPDVQSYTFEVPTAGKYYIAFGQTTSAMTLTLTQTDVDQLTVIDEPSVGIDSIENADEEAEYFDLQGVRIDRPAKGRIVIVRRGDKVSKEIAR